MFPDDFTRPVALDTLLAALQRSGGDHRPSALLVLNRPDFNAAGLPLNAMQQFPSEPGTGLYEVAALGQ
jgi:hypothetical protein